MREEIYKTKSASVAQSEKDNAFILSFGSDEITFKLCDLYALRRKILAIDVLELFDSANPDYEIIRLPNSDRFLMLSIQEILQFRELLNGTFDILALNSTVQRILRRNVFNI